MTFVAFFVRELVEGNSFDREDAWLGKNAKLQEILCKNDIFSAARFI